MVWNSALELSDIHVSGDVGHFFIFLGKVNTNLLVTFKSSWFFFVVLF